LRFAIIDPHFGHGGVGLPPKGSPVHYYIKEVLISRIYEDFPLL